MISSNTISNLSLVIKSLMVRKGFEFVPTMTEQPNTSVEVTMQLVPNFVSHERQSGKRLLVITAAYDCSNSNFGELHVLTKLAKQQHITIKPLPHFGHGIG
jgi:hypothetical protein